MDRFKKIQGRRASILIDSLPLSLSLSSSGCGTGKRAHVQDIGNTFAQDIGNTFLDLNKVIMLL